MKASVGIAEKAKLFDMLIEAVWIEEASKPNNRRLATIVRHLVEPYIAANRTAVRELIDEYGKEKK